MRKKLLNIRYDIRPCSEGAEKVREINRSYFRISRCQRVGRWPIPGRAKINDPKFGKTWDSSSLVGDIWKIHIRTIHISTKLYWVRLQEALRNKKQSPGLRLQILALIWINSSLFYACLAYKKKLIEISQICSIA